MVVRTMVKFTALFVLALGLIAALGGAPVAHAQSLTTVTVTVISSDSQAISGARVDYNPGGGWYTLGNTNGSGTVSKDLAAKSYSFRVAYNGTWSATQSQDIGTSPAVSFQTTKVSGEVKSSQGVALDGARVDYNPGGGWYTLGTTESTGTASKEIFPGTYTFRAAYKGTWSEVKPQDVTTNPLVPFMTTKVSGEVKSSQGAALDGARVDYNPGGGWYTLGTTNGGAPATNELFPGNYDFRAAYKGTWSAVVKQDVTASGNPLVTFTTALISGEVKSSLGAALDGARVDYNPGGGWYTLETTRGGAPATNELFPGNYDFRAAYKGTWSSVVKQDVTASGNPLVTFTTALISGEVKSSLGAALDGARVDYNPGGGWYTLETTRGGASATNELFPGNYDFRAAYKGTWSAVVKQDVTANGNPVVTFTTSLISSKVASCSGGAGQQGARVDYNPGGGWYTLGSTGADGVASNQLFPGNYSFRAALNGTWAATIAQNVAQNATVPFATTKVTLTYSGAVAYNPGGGWYTFRKPSMEIFPGTYTFRFSGQVASLNVSGCAVAMTTIKVIDSTGAAIPNASITYNPGNGWYTLGKTDANGMLAAALTPKSYSFQAAHASSRSAVVTKDLTIDTAVVFQTTKIVASVVDSQGGPLSGAQVNYNPGNGWLTLDYTNAQGQASKELFNNNLKFQASYNSSWSAEQTSPAFQTHKIRARVTTCAGAGIENAQVNYNPGNGWHTLGYSGADGWTSNELFPGTHGFQASYNSTWSAPISQAVDNNTPVSFTTTKVTISYAGEVIYNPGNGWHTFTKPAMELFPGTYPFQFDRQETSLNVSGCAVAMATIKVIDSTGRPIAGVPIVYGWGQGGWASGMYQLGTTNANGLLVKELAPKPYSFQASYNATTAAVLLQDVGSNSAVVFQTAKIFGEVKDSKGNPLAGSLVNYQRGQGGWYELGRTDASGRTAGKELFPGAYDFQAGYSATWSASKPLTVDASAPLVSFTTEPITAYVTTCSGAGIAGSLVNYQRGQGGWYELGRTDANGMATKEIFPGTYNFQANVNATWSAPISQAADKNTPVQLRTTTVTLTHSGAIIYSPTMSAVAWYSFTKPSMELFAGSYPFKFGNTATTIEVSGCAVSKVFNILRVKDSYGNPISGATARGGYGDNFGTWHVAGASDANGILIDMRDVSGQPTTMSYELRVNNTTATKTQDVSSSSTFDFQTVLLTLRVQSSDGAPQNGANIRYGSGSTYTTSWFPGGVTGSSASGETQAQFFPGTYSFEAQWRATADTRLNVSVPDTGGTVTWTTTTVTIQNFAGEISYGGASGDSTWFTGPSMELLPGSYVFHFRGGDTRTLTFSGDQYTYDYQTSTSS